MQGLDERGERETFEIEVNLNENSETTTNVWSGLKKGPPRKLKFPETQVIVDAIKKLLV